MTAESRVQMVNQHPYQAEGWNPAAEPSTLIISVLSGNIRMALAAMRNFTSALGVDWVEPDVEVCVTSNDVVLVIISVAFSGQVSGNVLWGICSYPCSSITSIYRPRKLAAPVALLYLKHSQHPMHKILIFLWFL
jgi:hypothetical protein